MSEQESITDAEILTDWYRYVANQSGFVAGALALLRERQDVTLSQQQRDFGASDEAFLHLQGILLPRSQSLAGDAHRIAEACGLSNPMAFVQAMLLAQRLKQPEMMINNEEFYQAAFDENNDLDEPQA